MTSLDLLSAFESMNVTTPNQKPLVDQYNGPALLSDAELVQQSILKDKIKNMAPERQKFLMNAWYNINILRCTYNPIIHYQLDNILQLPSSKSMKKCRICKFDVPMVYFMKNKRELRACGSCRALELQRVKKRMKQPTITESFRSK